jgi:hypothetical protein
VAAAPDPTTARIFVDGVKVLTSGGARMAAPEFQTDSVAGGAATDQGRAPRFRAAAVELWARNAADPAQAFVIPASWLSAEPQILPRGWSLQATDGGAAYTRADVSDGSVTLFGPDGSATSFAKTPFGLGYAPPPGVEDVVVVNPDGTVTVQADDGRTYLFRPDGGLDRTTRPSTTSGRRGQRQLRPDRAADRAHRPGFGPFGDAHLRRTHHVREGRCSAGTRMDHAHQDVCKINY